MPEKNSKFQAIIDNKKSILISEENGIYKVMDTEFKVDFAWLPDGRVHIIANGISYTANLLEFDVAKKKYKLEINGQDVEIRLKDSFDVQMESMGMKKNNQNRIHSIKAPMPGLVVKVFVKENQEVKMGDSLLILKAMKMENIIKSPIDMRIKKILVNNSDAVEKNQELILL